MLSPTSLKTTQFIVLRAIADNGEIAQWRLADQYGIAVETLSRRLANLRKAGFVIHRIGVERPGERLYRATPLGLQKLAEARPYFERAQQRLAMTLGDDNWNATLKMAELVSTAARSAESARTVNRPQVLAFAAAAAIK